MSADVTFDIVTASICALLIIVRCGYRILLRCKVHDTCHRMWHVDDAYMAFALLPLIGRTTCISLSFYLNPTHTYDAATEEAAAARNLSVEKLAEYYVISHKLLIPARIFYALFLWSLKLCLLNFYSRFVDIFGWGKAVTNALWWFIVITFFVILIPTLAECRPLYFMWSPDPTGANTCHRALGNLITMAVFNIVTDIALIIFPFPIFRHVKLDSKVKVQLVLLFSIAGVVVVITIMRLPMILNQAVSQRSRSMWASIEILCACIVANTAFFYALLKDYQRGHDSRGGNSSYVQQPDYYMQAIPSPELRRGSSARSDVKYGMSLLQATIFTSSFIIKSPHTSPASTPPSNRPHHSVLVNHDIPRPDTMTDTSTLSNLASYTFGGLCILSALPFVGIPFPNRRAADYYAGKSEWMSQIFRRRLTPGQAGYFGAALRIAVGAAVIVPETREPALLFNGAVVTYGTVRAFVDGRPMLPQWGMLAAIAICLGLGRLSQAVSVKEA
ncbi:integral membrane protein [Colletotrichum scovillei]|uniref:Integral membrane protein n=2 Tax=Colletotrichum scovillei TaxID=1209932 RepID=A0A9P7R200_9PEZI|nr:integral membrane protein [Colletotrichum scovillei]KAG7056609.1 integral membrane protein [Colletotrichum scovillei]KAG7066536.1 integral membrane protein [Colletotrichum scovillei]